MLSEPNTQHLEDTLIMIFESFRKLYFFIEMGERNKFLRKREKCVGLLFIATSNFKFVWITVTTKIFGSSAKDFYAHNVTHSVFVIILILLLSKSARVYITIALSIRRAHITSSKLT